MLEVRYRLVGDASLVVAGLPAGAFVLRLCSDDFTSPSCFVHSACVTAIMNRNIKDISTDLLLRVLYSPGYPLS